MPGILDIIKSTFASGNPGGGQQAANQQTQQQAAGNPTVPSAGTPQSNGSVPAIPAAGQGSASPLEGYKELWKVDASTNGSQPGNSDSFVPNFELDPVKLTEAASKIDFLATVPQDQLAAAMTDPEAMKAVINNGLRNVFANAMTGSGNLVTHSMGKAQEALLNKVLPESYRTQAVQAALADNPVFSNPAVAPVVDMVRDQMQRKYPTASPQEIANHALQFVQGMSQLVTSSTTGNGKVSGNSGANRGSLQKRDDNVDWVDWFSK